MLEQPAEFYDSTRAHVGNATTRFFCGLQTPFAPPDSGVALTPAQRLLWDSAMPARPSGVLAPVDFPP